jgi:DNA ligase-1
MLDAAPWWSAPLAQLDRAPGFEPGGRGFESCEARHFHLCAARPGKRLSFYSDYTFGVLADSENGEELVLIGKAYSGSTDGELAQLDRYVRNHTINRFGPLRQVEYNSDKGVVLQIAFEGINWSGRHKSGIALRFPCINRIRWDKPAGMRTGSAVLEGMLKAKG